MPASLAGTFAFARVAQEISDRLLEAARFAKGGSNGCCGSTLLDKSLWRTAAPMASPPLDHRLLQRREPNQHPKCRGRPLLPSLRTALTSWPSLQRGTPRRQPRGWPSMGTPAAYVSTRSGIAGTHQGSSEYTQVLAALPPNASCATAEVEPFGGGAARPSPRPCGSLRSNAWQPDCGRELPSTGTWEPAHCKHYDTVCCTLGAC